MKNEIKKLEHSSYRCQYHIVFAPKYRRKVIYGELKADIGKILRKLCNEKKVEIIVDRHMAIQKACSLAKKGDYILLAGKGHENYQEVNGLKTHFDHAIGLYILF